MAIKYLKVENEKSLVRDVTSKAILNTDLSAVKKHELRMRGIQKERSREEEINTIKNDIAEIRNLLVRLIEKK